MTAGLRWRRAVLAAALLAMLAPARGKAADVHETIAGWTLDDVGGKPGDDSDRSVTMHKALPEVAVGYSPGEGNASGSIQIKFGRCQGLSYSSGFGLGDPPSGHAAQVRRQIAEAFAEFAQSCPAKDQGEAKLMAGFDEAFARIESWVKTRPFVYPSEERSGRPPDMPELPDMAPDAPSAPAEPDIPMI